MLTYIYYIMYINIYYILLLCSSVKSAVCCYVLVFLKKYRGKMKK